MKTFNYIDVLAQRFHFFLHGNDKYYTSFGGLMSILFFSSCLSIFFYYSIDFVTKSHPITNKSQVYNNDYKKIQFGKEKIWIPWYIGDYNLKTINFTGLLYPIISYYQGERNKLTDTMPYNSTVIKWKKCSETGLINTSYVFEEGVAIENLWCIDMDDLIMGGQYTHTFVYHIEFDLYLCNDGGLYNESSPNCTSIKTLRDNIGKYNAWHFGYYYPQVEFRPHDLKNPFQINYKYMYYHLSVNSYKIERLFLSEHILNDDLGWINKKPKNITHWGLDKLTHDIYFNSKKNDDILNIETTSRLFQLNIFLSSGYTYYSRKFQKISELLSEIFPIFNIIYIFFRYICNFFTSVKLHDDLTNMVFERKKDKKFIGSNKINNKRQRRSVVLKEIPDLNNSLRNQNLLKSNIRKMKRTKTFLGMTKTENKIFLRPVDKDVFNIMNVSNINQNNNNSNTNLKALSFLGIRASKMKKLSPKEKKFRKKYDKKYNSRYYTKKNKEQLFPLYYYIFALHPLIFRRNCVSNEFIQIQSFLFRLYSINSYISLCQQFSVLKHEILTLDEANVLDSKIDVNSSKFHQRISYNLIQK